jgi:ATP-dependent DNA helicase Q4
MYNHSILQHDIHDAPSDIRNAYKLYYKMKTSLLEDTLSDILSEDTDFDSSQTDFMLSSEMSSQDLYSVLSPTQSSSQQFLVESPTDSVELQSFEYDPPPLPETGFEADSPVNPNQSAWGKELNQSQPKSQVESKAQPVKRQLSLSSKNFARKSIRKSFARTSSDISVASSQASQTSVRETLPDLETILAQKAKKAAESVTNLVEVSTTSGASKVSKDVDLGWLNRRRKKR